MDEIKDTYDIIESLIRNYDNGLVTLEEIGYVMVYGTGTDILDILSEIINKEDI